MQVLFSSAILHNSGCYFMYLRKMETRLLEEGGVILL